MRPYDRLAPYFGSVFPCTAEHAACYDRLLPDARGKRALDVGFGTGEHLAYLRERGAVIFGLEVEPELVEWARRRFPEEPDHFRVGSMTAVSAAFKDEQFDLVLLIGNTLPHAADRRQARRALLELAQVTDPAAVAVISLVNYDRILRERITELPVKRGETSEGKAWEFHRSYDLSEAPEKVLFRTRLITADASVEGGHSLLPLQRREAESAARAAFDEVEVYGGYLREPWSSKSFVTVLIAWHPRRQFRG